MSDSTANNIFSLLEQLEISTGFNVYIPSLEKEVKFKQLTTEQLKQILKTVVANPITNSGFTLAFNSIIKENCLDKDININNLTSYDKLFIALKTKIESISPDLIFAFTQDEIDSNKLTEDTKTISILEHFNKFANKKVSFTKDIIELNNCKVVCGIPTLDTENKFESGITNDYSNLTSEQLQELIGKTFINELAKHIYEVSIDGVKFDLTSETTENRIKVVEKLPVSIINKVLKYVETYKNSVNELLTYTFITDTGSIIEKEIPVDASLFNI